MNRCVSSVISYDTSLEPKLPVDTTTTNVFKKKDTGSTECGYVQPDYIYHTWFIYSIHVYKLLKTRVEANNRERERVRASHHSCTHNHR